MTESGPFDRTLPQGAVDPHPAPAFGRYEILDELGKGAMGVVYKAKDPLIERQVAIKTINLAMDPDEMAEYEARFYQEAKAAGGLNHPNIVTIYDIGKSGTIAFMAMEFLEGREVRAMLAEHKPLPVSQAVNIAAQVAEGLAFAHEHGVVHRDIKPANIMVVRDGLAKITDFGIARMRTSDVRTQTGIILGSPKYMAPEQIAGKRADHRSDIFSLGVVLYEMLTGRAPFDGENMTAIMLQTLNFQPEPPSSVNPEVPQFLDFVVAKLLSKRPDDRYQDGKELAADLRLSEQASQGETRAPARLDSVPEPLARSLESESEAPDTPAPLSRRSDAEEDASATRGLSKAFDSVDATMKLAAATGLAEEFDEFSRTRRLPAPETEPAPPYRVSDSMRQPALLTERRRRMSRYEKLIAGAALVAALLLATFIILG
jgi:eukaryotic-like serine/threonine-protein kinase